MARSIAVINLKGGVGKTTLAVALAETLAVSSRKRVLLVDLDPQTNATTMLIGGERWRELNQARLTLASLFRAEIDGKTFDLRPAIQKGVGNVAEAETLDLIPSSLDLIEIQDEMAQDAPAKYKLRSSSSILHKALKKELDHYDYVVFDCPPSLGLITRNGLRIADWFLIPVIPDILSTYGIQQILTKVRQFANATEHNIQPLGLVISKFKGITRLHNSVVEQLRNTEGYPDVLTPFVPDSIQIAVAAEHHHSYKDLRHKYGEAGSEAFRALTDRIRKRIKQESR